MKILKIKYDLTQEYTAAYFNTYYPNAGVYHFFDLIGYDDKGNKYILNLVHSGFTPVNSKSIDLIATFNVYRANNKNKLISSQTFNTQATQDGTFLKGNYFSPNNSKLIVDNTLLRTLILKVC